MAEYKRCDRCGTSNEGHREVEINWVSVQVYVTSTAPETRYLGGYSQHLCKACRDALAEFLKPRSEGRP